MLLVKEENLQYILIINLSTHTESFGQECWGREMSRVSIGTILILSELSSS